MKRFIIIMVCFVAYSSFADRIDIWSASSINVQHVDLFKTADGGCLVVASAVIQKQDGGISNDYSKATEVSGANQTACLDILNTRAPVLFKADKGL